VHGGFRPGDLSYVQGWGWGAFYILMGSFLYSGRRLTIAVFGLSCLAFGHSWAPDAGQHADAAKAGANSRPAQVKIEIRGRVVDLNGAVVGNAMVLFRTKQAGGCALDNGRPSSTVAAQTNQFGEFSAMLPPAEYAVWIQGFPKRCVEFTVTGASSTAEPLNLNISPEDQIRDSTLPESRFQKVAGTEAISCGRVGINKDRTQATGCAVRAYKDHKAFYVIYDEAGIDSFISGGMAWNGKEPPYYISYDSMGVTYDLPLPDSSLPYDSDTHLTACSKPVRVYVNASGEVDCVLERELWEQGIEAGSRETILNAGETGYYELIPALRKRLVDTEMGDDPEDKDAVRMALAKLGDREQMQALECELETGTPLEMQTVALDKISYVGGWYAIRIYRELLMPAAKARFDKARFREQGDLALSEPRWWALSSLLKVAPYPPPPGIEYGFNLAQMPEYSQIWLAWIAKNEGKLKKLQPTGKDVDLSGKPCKSIRGYLKQQVGSAALL
jgi:hypothetical protein